MAYHGTATRAPGSQPMPSRLSSMTPRAHCAYKFDTHRVAPPRSLIWVRPVWRLRPQSSSLPLLILSIPRTGRVPPPGLPLARERHGGDDAPGPGDDPTWSGRQQETTGDSTCSVAPSCNPPPRLPRAGCACAARRPRRRCAACCASSPRPTWPTWTRSGTTLYVVRNASLLFFDNVVRRGQQSRAEAADVRGVRFTSEDGLVLDVQAAHGPEVPRQ